MLPVVAFIGPHAVGKTTVVSGVVRVLRARGVRVGVLKSTKEPRGETDRPGTDTHRLREAGADPVALWAAEETVVYRRAPSREEFWSFLLRNFWDCNLVIAEGFKTLSFLPKVEVAREEVFRELLCHRVPGVVALAADFDPGVGLPVFDLEDFEGLADFILRRYVRARGPRVSLLVDGKPVGLNAYVRRALTGILRGFLQSLKGVPRRFSEVEIRFKVDRLDQEEIQGSAEEK